MVELWCHLPVVYADATSDGAARYDADTVQITCPAGHRWTWRTGRELITETGTATTVRSVFGPDLTAPFTRCPACADAQHDRGEPCPCDGASLILCPRCAARCDVDLPATSPA